MAEHNELGMLGEDIAADFLSTQGLRILEKNFRFRSLEIDIIARNAKTLIIVEVKTRSSSDIAFPRDSINIAKQRRLFNAAQAFIESRKLMLDVRFDIIEINMIKGKPNINWILDAFSPGW
jgi:putative endonuclease